MPDGSICDGGELRPEHVWAALDCPTYFGAILDGPPRFAVLGRLEAEIRELPREGQRYVVLGWPLGAEGRKLYGAAALVDERGRWLARSRATWIELRNGS